MRIASHLKLKQDIIHLSIYLLYIYIYIYIAIKSSAYAIKTTSERAIQETAKETRVI